MASIWLSKSMWRAVGLTLCLHFIYELATHQLFNDVAQNFSAFVDDEEARSAMTEDINDPLITKKMIKDVLLAALLLPFDYQWQVWLESRFPSRPRAKIVEFKEKPMADVSEALEDEIMRRLIAEGKVQRASLRWGNVLVKILMDLFVGSIIFGTMWVPINALAKLNFWSITHWAVLDGVVSQLVTRLFSGWLFISFIRFTLVPVEHRLPFEAVMQLIFAVFVGAFLNKFLPWFTSTEAFKEGMANGKVMAEIEAAKRNATGNLTMTTNTTELENTTVESARKTVATLL